MATQARRAEYTRAGDERFLREREARRRRFEAPLFDFVTPHSDAIAEEKAARQKKLQERKARLCSVIENSTSGKSTLEEGEFSGSSGPSTQALKAPRSHSDGSVNLYEAMYLSKGALITPEDYSDHNQHATAQGKEALANINSVILRNRSRRALDCRDEPTDLNLAVAKLQEERQSVADGRESTGRNADDFGPAKVRLVRVDNVPWFNLMFRPYDCRQASTWREENPNYQFGLDARNRLKLYSAFSPTQRLHEEILAFVAWADLTEDETDARTHTLANISIVSQALWKSAVLTPFGSFFNGLSLPGADIDICIHNVPSGENTRNEIHDLARLLRLCPFAQDITTVTKARVPIVKFRSTHSDVQVDLTINQDSAVDTSEFIQDRLEQWRPLRPLILVVKLLLRNDDLNETYKGGVGSYMLLNMLTHHLQMEAKQRAPPNENAKSLATYIESLNLGDLLLSFLQRYANFDYVFDAIDTRGDGALVNKSEWSDEMCNRLYVVSPLEPRLDVGKSSYNMEEVVDLFSRTHRRLREAIERCESGDGHDELSLLAQVLKPDAEAFRNRPIDPQNHPWRSDFTIYRRPPFPQVTEGLLQNCFYDLENCIQEFHLRWRHVPRSRAPYENGHERYGENGGNNNNTRRRPALTRDYDRHR